MRRYVHHIILTNKYEYVLIQANVEKSYYLLLLVLSINFYNPKQKDSPYYFVWFDKILQSKNAMNQKYIYDRQTTDSPILFSSF